MSKRHYVRTVGRDGKGSRTAKPAAEHQPPEHVPAPIKLRQIAFLDRSRWFDWEKVPVHRWKIPSRVTE